MGTAFVTTRRVEFADTDAAGIMHFSAFFRLMEEAEHELLRSVGLSVISASERGVISWPRVHAHCDYEAAARFEDLLSLAVTIARIGEKSVTFRHEITRGGEPIAAGEITAVCCLVEPERTPTPIRIPDFFRVPLAAFHSPPSG